MHNVPKDNKLCSICSITNLYQVMSNLTLSTKILMVRLHPPPSLTLSLSLSYSLLPPPPLSLSPSFSDLLFLFFLDRIDIRYFLSSFGPFFLFCEITFYFKFEFRFFPPLKKKKKKERERKREKNFNKRKRGEKKEFK
ncbi:hypothetical protein P5V15_003749 [Pogonomyrmex californicus]